MESHILRVPIIWL